MSGFKLAVCQLKVSEDKQHNIDHARNMTRLAAEQGAQMVMLPEMFNCPYETKLFPLYAEDYSSGETVEMLSQTASEFGIVLVGGSIPETELGNVYNTCFVFGPQGDLLGRYRKTHLFNVDLPGLPVRESETLTSGYEFTTIDVGIGKIGLMICFDVRFPEMARLLTLAGIDVLLVPGAFNMVTGPAHWHLTMRVRAMDNQIYVAAASPARDENVTYVAYGHSMIVDPWGEVVAQAGPGEEIIMAEIDRSKIQSVRERLPLLTQRREDLYSLKKL